MLYVLDSGEKLATTITAYEGDISGGAYFGSPLFVADEEKIEQSLVYFKFEQEEEINGLNTISLEVPANHAESVYVVEGNYIVFQDYDLNWQMYEIKQVTDTHDDGGVIRAVYAEHIYYEMIEDIIEDKGVIDNTAGAGLAKALLGSDWEMKIAEPTKIGTVSFYYISRLEAIQKVREVFGGELKFEIEFNGSAITHKYVSLLNRLGSDTGKQFTYNRDMMSIKRVSDTKNIMTACYGRGKGVEVGTSEDGVTTYGRRLDLGELVWVKANGDKCDKPLNMLYLVDEDALTRWGRKGGTVHRFGIFEDDDETDIVNLANKTWDYLQAHTKPTVSYEMKVLDLERLAGYEHEAVRLGDVVLVLDKAFNPPILVSAEVIKLKRDYINSDNNDITVGNFRENFWNMDNDVKKRMNDVSSKFGVYDRAGMINYDGTISTSMLQGVIDTLQNEINSSGGKVTITEENGIMVLDKASNPTKAMRLTAMGFGIANAKNADGTWNWRTFGTGDGFVADEVRTGTLLGNKGKFDLTNGMFRLGNSDSDYKLYFDGTNLTMLGSVNLPNAGISNDANSLVRLYAGANDANKETAPFRVLQDGSVYARTGTFGGTFTGRIDIGNIHISDTDPNTNGGASFRIKTDGDSATVVKFEEADAFIDTSFTLGNDNTKYLYFNKTLKTLELMDVSYRIKKTDGSVNDVFFPNTASGNLIEFAGSKFSFDVDSMNDFVFQSNSPTADMDFKFVKLNSSGAVVANGASVHINGELMVTSGVDYGDKITLKVNTTAGNQGIDFVIN